MQPNFYKISTDDVDLLMNIEEASHTHPWNKTTFKSCIGDRYFGYYLVNNKKVVGFYIGEYVADEATLMDICVHPAEQGKGFGKLLLLNFSDKASSLGAKTLFLEVRAKNLSAIMLYINQGFAEIGRRTGYYPAEIGYEDAIVMKKELNNKR